MLHVTAPPTAAKGGLLWGLKGEDGSEVRAPGMGAALGGHPGPLRPYTRYQPWRGEWGMKTELRLCFTEADGTVAAASPIPSSSNTSERPNPVTALAAVVALSFPSNRTGPGALGDLLTLQRRLETLLEFCSCLGVCRTRIALSWGRAVGPQQRGSAPELHQELMGWDGTRCFTGKEMLNACRSVLME